MYRSASAICATRSLLEFLLDRELESLTCGVVYCEFVSFRLEFITVFLFLSFTVYVESYCTESTVRVLEFTNTNMLTHEYLLSKHYVRISQIRDCIRISSIEPRDVHDG